MIGFDGSTLSHASRASLPPADMKHGFGASVQATGRERTLNAVPRGQGEDKGRQRGKMSN